MSLRSSILLGWVAAVLAAGPLGCTPAENGPPERIVLIVIDTLRQDHLSCYGGRVETLHIDGLAARGRLFTNARSSFHQTTMSMGALFTGRTPGLETGDRTRPLEWTGRTWCGMGRFSDSLGRRGHCLPRTLATLGEAMTGAGYWTMGVASNHLLFGRAGFSRGFDDWMEVGKVPPRAETTQRARRLEQHAARAGGPVNQAVAELLDRRSSDRFFLYVHYMDVHDYAPSYVYAEGVKRADAAVGQLLDLLEERSLLDGTVVVLTADHGERLRETYPVRGGISHRGNPSFEPVLQVPLVVAPPAFGSPDRLIRSEDLHRLLRELAGLEPGDGSDLDDEEHFVSEMKWQTYRRGRWKSTWSRLGDQALLFDLLEDPAESVDVSGDHPEVLARHRDRIAELTDRLATGQRSVDPLTDDDRERLRALGYLDEDGPEAGP